MNKIFLYTQVNLLRFGHVLFLANMRRYSSAIFSNNTGAKHTATVIFCHGSGGNGKDMKEWVDLVARNFEFPHIKVLYPTAPLQPYTPAGGSLRNVWFDRAAIDQNVSEKWSSIEKMEKTIKKYIVDENEIGIPTNRIIVGGFSMGGALALYTGYKWVRDLAGVFAFSSFLNNNTVIYKELKILKDGTRLPPLLQIHGTDDDLVPLEWSQNTFSNLKDSGVHGDFHIMEGLGHSVNKKGLNIIKEWIDQRLPEV